MVRFHQHSQCEKKVRSDVAKYEAAELHKYMYLCACTHALVHIPSESMFVFLSLSKYIEQSKDCITLSPLAIMPLLLALLFHRKLETCLHVRKRDDGYEPRTCFAACCSFSCPWLPLLHSFVRQSLTLYRRCIAFRLLDWLSMGTHSI